MTEGENGPLNMEVNWKLILSACLGMLQVSTQLDVADAIVDDMTSEVNFPEIDVRQRLQLLKKHADGG
jgi:ribosomal protein S6--L-glutamate ligase